MTLADLKAQLVVAQQKLAADQTQVINAQIALTAAEDALGAAQDAVTADEALIADLETKIAEASKIVTTGGIWCQAGGWHTQLQIEGQLGYAFQIGRASSSEGQPDDTLLGDDTIAAIASGHHPSLQFQPKTGSGGDRVGIPYQDVIDGKYDAWFLNECKKIASHIAPGAKEPFEVKSEFDIPRTPVQHTAQPWNGALSLYSPFFIHIAGLINKAGIADRVTLIAGTGALHTWTDNSWHTALDGALAAGVVEGIAVDGYAKQANTWQSAASILSGVLAVAKQIKLPPSWLEFGCSAFPGRPAWYAATKKTLMATPQLQFVVTNATLANYDPRTDAKSYAAWQDMMSLYRA